MNFVIWKSNLQCEELQELHFLWIFAHSTVVGYVCKADRLVFSLMHFVIKTQCSNGESEFYQDFLYAFLLRQFFGNFWVLPIFGSGILNSDFRHCGQNWRFSAKWVLLGLKSKKAAPKKRQI